MDMRWVESGWGMDGCGIGGGWNRWGMGGRGMDGRGMGGWGMDGWGMSGGEWMDLWEGAIAFTFIIYQRVNTKFLCGWVFSHLIYLRKGGMNRKSGGRKGVSMREKDGASIRK